MTTLLEIWNGARTRIGLDEYAGVDGVDQMSRTMRRRTPELIAEALELYPMNWAMKREALNPAADPVTGDAVTSVSHSYVYEKPGWVQRVVGYSIDGTDEGIIRFRFREEAGRIHCDYDTLYVIGVASDRMLDYGAMPMLFRRWLALALACEICPQTEDRFKLDDIKKERDTQWSKMTVADAQQGPDEPKETGSWNRARSGHSGDDYRRWG